MSKEQKEIILDYTAEGLPVWEKDDGTIVEGLTKNEFKAKGAEPKLMWPEYFRYMEKFKIRKAAEFTEKAKKATDEAVSYAEKARTYGIEASPEEKAKKATLDLMAKVAKQKAKLVEMGVSEEELKSLGF